MPKTTRRQRRHGAAQGKCAGVCGALLGPQQPQAVYRLLRVRSRKLVLFSVFVFGL